MFVIPLCIYHVVVHCMCVFMCVRSRLNNPQTYNCLFVFGMNRGTDQVITLSVGLGESAFGALALTFRALGTNQIASTPSEAIAMLCVD